MQIVGSQLGNVQRKVLLRRENMIGLAVIVNEECHVTRHLPNIVVTLEVFVKSHGRTLHRPRAGISTLRVEELIRAFRTVGHGHTIACSIVPPTLQLEVKPHTELFRYGIVDDLRTLHDAATLNVVTPLVADAEGNAAVAPVHQIFRGIAHHAHQCIAGTLALMLAEPVVSITVFHYATAVGVDVTPRVVAPQLTAAYGLRFLLPPVPILLQSLGLGLGDVDD